MEPTIRRYLEGDGPDVVGLSLRAWAPVFEAERAALGDEIVGRLSAEGQQEQQRKDVEATLADADTTVWVADVDGRAVGFVAVTLDEARGIGEIWMLAVDPAHQSHGIGSRLTDVATDWIRERGLPLAMIETGGDDGHGPARSTYEKAGYTPMPIVRYFKAL
jgi:ribosomal protein S18 acetylase RimI-like enzyme